MTFLTGLLPMCPYPAQSGISQPTANISGRVCCTELWTHSVYDSAHGCPSMIFNAANTESLATCCMASLLSYILGRQLRPSPILCGAHEYLTWPGRIGGQATKLGMTFPASRSFVKLAIWLRKHAYPPLHPKKEISQDALKLWGQRAREFCQSNFRKSPFILFFSVNKY